MPVTIKLSREFYEKFGDKVVDEMVGLFNQVDATYRSELRELNEQNFARFDDKLERRLTEFRADFDRRLGDLDAKVERRFAVFGADLDRRLGELETKVDRRLTELDSKWERRIGDLRAELIKWMFLFWLGTVASVLGIGRALLR
jgi:ABC-type phosphate transport system auxiliary subunit